MDVEEEIGTPLTKPWKQNIDSDDNQHGPRGQSLRVLFRECVFYCLDVLCISVRCGASIIIVVCFHLSPHLLCIIFGQLTELTMSHLYYYEKGCEKFDILNIQQEIILEDN